MISTGESQDTVSTAPNNRHDFKQLSIRLQLILNAVSIWFTDVSTQHVTFIKGILGVDGYINLSRFPFNALRNAKMLSSAFAFLVLDSVNKQNMDRDF